MDGLSTIFCSQQAQKSQKLIQELLCLVINQTSTAEHKDFQIFQQMVQILVGEVLQQPKSDNLNSHLVIKDSILQALGNLIMSDEQTQQQNNYYNMIVTQPFIDTILQLILYRRPTLSETCFWCLNNILGLDSSNPPNAEVANYIKSHKDIKIAVKTNFDGFKSKSPDLKYELVRTT